MSHMNPTVMLAALDVGHLAIKPPMTDLITEPTFFPEWAFPVAMIRIMGLALTTVLDSAHYNCGFLPPCPVALAVIDARPLS